MKENSWNSTKEKNIFDISKVTEDAQKNFKKIDLKNQQFREGRWTKEEHNSFVNEILRVGIKNWKKLEGKIKTRNNCQIRSHFQKYLKKICSRYNLSRSLNEIFVTPEKLPKISPLDLTIIEIFNSYKRMRISTRKNKLTFAYKKRLAKKKFFKIKKSIGERLVRTKEKKIEKVLNNEPIQESEIDSKKEGNMEVDRNDKCTDCSIPDEKTNSDFLEKENILKKINEIKNMNTWFLEQMNNNWDFNFEKSFLLAHYHLAKYYEIVNK